VYDIGFQEYPVQNVAFPVFRPPTGLVSGKLLLASAGAVILDSGFSGINGHIFLSYQS
jgi:hypothetical protein